MRWLVAVFFCSCTSVQLHRVPDGLEVQGKAKGVVQVNRSTLTLFADYIDVIDIGLEVTTEALLSEVRALGARPRLLSLRTTPRGGWRAFACLLVCVNETEVVALAVEEE